MMRYFLLSAALALALAGAALAQGAYAGEAPAMRTRMTLEQRVGSEVFQRAGLARLSPQEQQILSDWIRDYTQEITSFVERRCRKQKADQPAKP